MGMDGAGGPGGSALGIHSARLARRMSNDRSITYLSIGHLHCHLTQGLALDAPASVLQNGDLRPDSGPATWQSPFLQ